MISQNNEAWKILILDGLGAEARARVGFFVPNVPDDVKEELVPAMRWRPRCARRSRVVQSCASVAARIVSCFQTDRVVTCAELCSCGVVCKVGFGWFWGRVACSVAARSRVLDCAALCTR